MKKIFAKFVNTTMYLLFKLSSVALIIALIIAMFMGLWHYADVLGAIVAIIIMIFIISMIGCYISNNIITIENKKDKRK